MAHDVSRELRGVHGRWSRSAEALKRMSDEARKPPDLQEIHNQVKGVSNGPVGSGKQINRFSVHNMGDKGIRVRMPGQTQHYKDPVEASVAVFEGKHHEGKSNLGEFLRAVTAGEPEVKREPTLEERFKGQVGQAPEVIHPGSLDIAQSASKGTDRNKTMRQQVLKASTHQGQVTPNLVKKTQVTITNAPHGKRGGTTLASHTGTGNTLHVKPEVLIGSNAQSVLDHSAKQGWWVPTDKQHDLSMNVMTHEYGHGVHGEMRKRGIIMTTKANGYASYKPEQDFWRGLAKKLGTRDPEMVSQPFGSSYGRPGDNNYMDIGNWFSRNKAAIKKGVSTYGAENINEMMAELWTEYRLSSNPRPAAKYVGDYITSHPDAKEM